MRLGYSRVSTGGSRGSLIKPLGDILVGICGALDVRNWGGVYFSFLFSEARDRHVSKVYT